MIFCSYSFCSLLGKIPKRKVVPAARSDLLWAVCKKTLAIWGLASERSRAAKVLLPTKEERRRKQQPISFHCTPKSSYHHRWHASKPLSAVGPLYPCRRHPRLEGIARDSAKGMRRLRSFLHFCRVAYRCLQMLRAVPMQRWLPGQAILISVWVLVDSPPRGFGSLADRHLIKAEEQWTWKILWSLCHLCRCFLSLLWSPSHHQEQS